MYRLEIGEGDDIRTINGFPEPEKAPAQIRFTVDQTPNAERSYAEITIYGLNRDSRKAIYSEGDTIRLIAGWQDGYGSIFDGEIKNVAAGREGAETFLTLYCQSLAGQWATTYINRSFGAGTPVRDIVSAVAETLGPVEFVGDLQLPTAINGKNIQGTARQAMNQLANSFGFEWMIENRRVVVHKPGAVRDQAEPFRYNALSGLIGSPEITQKGVDIDVLMNPFIRPWDLFELEAVTAALSFNGIYYQSQQFPEINGKGTNQAISLVHEGDFYGDRWQTRIEGRRL